MPVIKSQLAKYRVFRNGECATIALGDWANPKVDGKPVTYSGELLVHSSLGSFSYMGHCCTVPFKQFLAHIDLDSFVQKCLGRAYQEFDGQETVTKLKRAVLHLRRRKLFPSQAARELWAELDAQRSEAELLTAVEDLGSTSTLLGPWETYRSYRPTAQALSLWNKLWPDFVAELKEELAPAAPREQPGTAEATADEFLLATC